MKWGIDRSPVMSRLSQLPACGAFIGRQYDRYLRAKYKVNWRWGRNPASRRMLHADSPTLNPTQQRLVEDLLATGVAICHITDLFPDGPLWGELSALISQFGASDEVQSVVKKRQEDFGATKDLSSVGHYIITYYNQDSKPLITADNPLLHLGLDPLVLDVANSYLGLWSKLIYFDMWYTLPLNTETRILSQRWHRDPEDRRKVRTFLYFNEVDSGNGAMEYLMGSHVGGPFEQIFPWKDPLSMPYPPDGEVERLIPPSQRKVLSGPPGTVVFCDTAGFHRGGTTKTRPRILATSAYVTPASLHGRRFEIDGAVLAADWSPAARFAVSRPSLPELLGARPGARPSSSVPARSAPSVARQGGLSAVDNMVQSGIYPKRDAQNR
jgi:hypothetical protein